jgi:peptide/nickel transport system permease protein
MKGPLLILLLWLLAALAGPAFSDLALRVDLPAILAGPGEAGLLGRDELGRDVLARVLGGAGTALWVSLLVVSLSAVIGTAIGLLAGYLGGWLDRLTGRLIDVFLAFPGILLAIALAAALGPGLGNLVLALSLMGWVGFARLARAQALSLRGREHVQAALALGAGHGRIIGRHLLPLTLAPILVEVSFGVANVVIAEAGLSFLGLGVQPPQASWGSMIRDGVRYMLVAPHLVLAPGAALCLVVFAANRLGDALRDRLDSSARAVAPQRT